MVYEGERNSEKEELDKRLVIKRKKDRLLRRYQSSFFQSLTFFAIIIISLEVERGFTIQNKIKVRLSRFF